MSSAKENPSSQIHLTVGPDDENQRLDTYLSSKCAQLSRSYFKRLIQDGLVLVNGYAAKPRYEIRAGDAIVFSLPGPEEDGQGQLTPQPMDLEVLYEDEDILAINKSPGVVVHPGAGHEEGTLVHGLLAHCTRLAMQGAPQRPGIVHRLDQDTSGALVVAKTERAYLDLIQQFKEHTVDKIYLALVFGKMPQQQGVVKSLLDRHPSDRKRMAVVQGRGREAISHWKVEKSWGEISLLRVRIETGRTHQIRVHLSHMGHSVVGDATYGGGKRRAQSIQSKEVRQIIMAVDRQMLHAWKLSFPHPITRVPLSFTAPLPLDFESVLSQLEEASKGRE